MKSAALLAVVAALCVGSAAAAANPCRGQKNGSLFPAGGCSAVYYQVFILLL
jgi:opacity protein-like surface antigen